ncbi:MAG: hypothetical protein KBC78_02515 [Candidatus Pacebacteria bacterium]|nr:hypothetical protein [Candidatus Paceibacterota bacterium]
MKFTTIRRNIMLFFRDITQHIKIEFLSLLKLFPTNPNLKLRLGSDTKTNSISAWNRSKIKDIKK